MLKICLATSVHYPLDTRIYFKQVLSLSESFTVDYYAQSYEGIRPGPSGKFFPLPRANSRLGRIRTNYHLLKLLRGSDYDVYHIHDHELVCLGILMKLRGRRVFFDMHEDISKQVMDKEWIPSIFRGAFSVLLGMLDKMLPLMFDHVILTDDAYLEKYRGRKNVSVIHNYPVTQKEVRSGRRSGAFKMVYVGDIRKVRGIMEYLEILKTAKAGGMDIKLLLIGRYAGADIEKEVNEHIRANSLDDDVVYYGRLPNDRIYDILRESDLGLSILHPIGNYLESYPTKLFEYMSVGLPVLASKFELWDRVVGESGCGYTVEPFDIKGACDIISKYYNDPGLLREHGKNGIDAVNTRFNWELEAERLMKIYNN